MYAPRSCMWKSLLKGAFGGFVFLLNSNNSMIHHFALEFTIWIFLPSNNLSSEEWKSAERS